MFVNTETLREEALHFKKYGYYCPDPEGSVGFYNYWSEQLRRCKEGYSSGGMHITGNHYAYLNFSEIQLTDEANHTEKVTKSRKKRSGKKIRTFPDFWDGDYNYFWGLEIAENGIDEAKLKTLNLDYKPIWIDGGHHMMVSKARRKGFEQPVSEMIETPKGQKTMGSLRVGDHVIGSSGKPVKITDVIPQGITEVWEVTLRDGRKVKCGKNHLWSVIDFKGNKRVVTTEYLAKVKLIKNKGKSNTYFHWYIANTKAVEYPKKDLPIDPYSLGVYLGDGCYTYTQKGIQITSEDPDIIDRLKIGPYTKSGIQYRFYDEDLKKNITDLGLRCYSYEKRIPYDYLESSIEDRMDLLRGLLDTDGTSSPNGTIRFGTSSLLLKKGIERLLASLGIRYYSTEGKMFEGTYAKRSHYVISIVTDKDVFYLDRKLKNIRKDRKYCFNKVPIVSVKSLGYFEEQQCITVDAEDSLYLTSNYVVTHNSYKNSLVCANRYNTIKNSTSLIGAFESKYLFPEGTMTMANNNLNFFNEHTGWRKRRSIDRADHKRASYKVSNNGIEVEKGYKSQIIAVTFKNNPQAARGKDASLILFEEAGTFDNLKQAFLATEPTITDGAVITGIIVMFGTGGDMEKGTIDFESMFMNPETYNIMPYENMWDEGKGGTTCGFFFPDYQNKPGFIDKNGNSQKELAKAFETEIREEMKRNTKDMSVIDRHITEYAFCPSEAFLQLSSNIFPVSTLLNWRNYLMTDKSISNIAVHGKLEKSGSKVKFKPDPKVRPITKFPHDKGDRLEGCVSIYQSPYKNEGGIIPNNLYIICHDPYAHDTMFGASLGAAYVIKRHNNFSVPSDMIVASYVGRPHSQDEYNYNLFLLAEYYNAKIGFENDRGDVIGYAKRFKKLNQLIEEVEIIDKKENINIKKLGRKFGVSMGSKERKGQGDIYLRDWLLTPNGKSHAGEETLNLHRIYDIALLDELIKYSPDGNFDRVAAMRVGMYHLQDMFNKEVKPTQKKERAFFNRVFFT